MSYDLWAEASADIEAEQSQLSLSRAKVAVAGLWPFLSMARSAGEFEHRLALANGDLMDRVPVQLVDGVVASLRDDFLTLRATAADGDADADDESDGESDGDPDDPGKPWEKSARSKSDVDRSEWADDTKRTDDQDEDDDPDEAASWRDLGKKGTRRTAQFFHAGLGRWVALDDDANSGKGNPAYFTGGPEHGPATGETNQFPTFPAGNSGDPWNPMNSQYPMQPSPWVTPPDKVWREEPMQFNPPGGGYHPASRRPFATTAAKVGENGKCVDCNQPVEYIKNSDGDKWWSHTGRYGAQADDDHTPWPDKHKNASRRTAQEGIVPTPGPNPNYFAAGDEGTAGSQQGGFPPDITLPEDVDDWMVDQYGAVPPAPSASPYRTATQEHRAPGSDRNLGTEFDSQEERERYRAMVAGDDPGDRDSSVIGSRRQAFYDPYDPSVRVVAADATDPTGGSSGNPYTSAPPPAPPSMTPGQPGAEAMPPMTAPGMGMGMGGGVPQSTPPRQMPGGGGAPAQNVPQPTAARRVLADESRNRPTSANPYGTDDPFDAKTWDSASHQRPMMPMEHMNFNGPQNPNARAPIRTTTSPGAGGQRDEEEDEDD